MALHCLSINPPVAVARGVFGWLEAGDAVLLLGPAATLARGRHPQLESWLSHEVTLYALADELALQGVTAVDPRVRVTDYTGWVELVVEHPQQMNWD